jgi:Mg2+/citrate symporter
MIFLRDQCFAQIFILLAVSLIFQILLLCAKPMTEKWDQRMAVVIEASVSIYLRSLLSLSDFSGENTRRKELGWVLAILTAIVIGTNVINVILFLWKILCRAVVFIKLVLQRVSEQENRTVSIKPDDGNLSLH